MVVDATTDEERSRLMMDWVERSSFGPVRWILWLARTIKHYQMFNLDGTPRVHIRRNGSRYIYPEALVKSPEYRRVFRLDDPPEESDKATIVG